MAKNMNDRPKTPEMNDDGWGDADEVLVPTGIPVHSLGGEKGKNLETITGVYLGYREVDSDYGPVKIHYFLNPQRDPVLFGIWGSLGIDSGLANSQIGRETRVDNLGAEDLDGGKTLRKVRIRQRGSVMNALPALPANTSNGERTSDVAPF